MPKCHKMPKCLHFGSGFCIRIFFLLDFLKSDSTTLIDNHYIQWCRCHVVIITCRKLHCQEWPWPSKSSSFQMLIFPCTLYIVHVSNNPLLLTMTLFVHTITNNCFHGEKTKKNHQFFCSCDYSQTLTHTHTQISLFCKRVKLLVMIRVA